MYDSTRTRGLERNTQTQRVWCNCVVRLDARARYAILKDRNVTIRTVKRQCAECYKKRHVSSPPEGLWTTALPQSGEENGNFNHLLRRSAAVDTTLRAT